MQEAVSDGPKLPGHDRLTQSWFDLLKSSMLATPFLKALISLFMHEIVSDGPKLLGHDLLIQSWFD
ncbi:hypothetical protein GCM10025772_18420 [Ferrimonas gelatinilytica]|uniref:Uncharacterized protein n=1 Tax=Ferrimonas gelatinilytica TaxID=1255257 RepID=A0ABP9S7Q4_9GAMM